MSFKDFSTAHHDAAKGAKPAQSPKPAMKAAPKSPQPQKSAPPAH